MAATVFDKEEWSIQRMYEERGFAGMRNVVDAQINGDRVDIPVAVPTELFKYAREVLNVEDMDNVFMYLDHSEGRYIFGVGTSNCYHDLWTYRQLPAWATLT